MALCLSKPHGNPCSRPLSHGRLLLGTVLMKNTTTRMMVWHDDDDDRDTKCENDDHYSVSDMYYTELKSRSIIALALCGGHSSKLC